MGPSYSFVQFGPVALAACLDFLWNFPKSAQATVAFWPSTGPPGVSPSSGHQTAASFERCYLLCMGPNNAWPPPLFTSLNRRRLLFPSSPSLYKAAPTTTSPHHAPQLSSLPSTSHTERRRRAMLSTVASPPHRLSAQGELTARVPAPPFCLPCLRGKSPCPRAAARPSFDKLRPPATMRSTVDPWTGHSCAVHNPWTRSTAFPF
jgi:hypothetical protein